MINYFKIMTNELENALDYMKDKLKKCEDNKCENMLFSIKAVHFCIDYLNIRFMNNYKHYNNDESKAYDLFSAKKAIEYFNIYVEELYFLDKAETEQNYYFRKELRRIICLLNDVISNVKSK